MNRTRLAQALNTIAVGFAEAAEALSDDQEAQPTLGDVSTSFVSHAPPEGSLEACPRHHKEYRSGKVTKPNPSGKFCASRADDAWSYHGWCSINPSNAAEYLRQAAG